MLNLEKTTCLVIAPHPDDEVIGCGGLINKIKTLGGKVYVLYMTVGTTKEFNGQGTTSHAEQRIAEIGQVADLLHFDGWRIAFAGDQYHLQLDRVSQKEIIHEIEQGKDISLETIRPDILAVPIVEDYNQDHRASAHAALTACRPAPHTSKYTPPFIVSYETPMNGWSSFHTTVQPNLIVELSESDLQAKVASMNAYGSQVRGEGHPRHTTTLEALARLRGALIGSMFAEAYYCHKATVR